MFLEMPDEEQLHAAVGRRCSGMSSLAFEAARMVRVQPVVVQDKFDSWNKANSWEM
jgi:hypothetical protein